MFFLVVLLSLGFAKTRWNELEAKNYDFRQYVAEFGKTFASVSEARMREKIFNKNLQDIKAHNKGAHTWKKGVNQFTDRTPEEFKKVLGVNRGILYSETPTVRVSAATGVPLRRNVDW